jgi:hypothetical protein
MVGRVLVLHSRVTVVITVSWSPAGRAQAPDVIKPGNQRLAVHPQWHAPCSLRGRIHKPGELP